MNNTLKQLQEKRKYPQEMLLMAGCPGCGLETNRQFVENIIDEITTIAYNAGYDAGWQTVGGTGSYMYNAGKADMLDTVGSVLKVVAIDSQKDCDGEDEVYCNWYKCPSCKNPYVRNRDNYCSDCGCKFEWSGE